MIKEEMLPIVTEYFDGDSMAANVWIDKYAMKTQLGEILEATPNDMHHRLAKEFARIEDKYPNPLSEEEIFELLHGFKYIVPQGSPAAGVGNPHLIISLSNCFVIGNDADSYGGIMNTDEEQVQLMKRRGGVGHDLSHLRPSGAIANNAALNDMAGMVLYAQRYSNSTKEVRQGDRRGALMLSVSVKHPDTEKFIDAKLESGKITDANMSVRVSDEFMKAVKEDKDFIQTFPIDIDYTHHTPFLEMLHNNEIEYGKLISLEIDGEFKGCYAKRIKAKNIWDKIIKNAHKSAEPGVLFWDTIIRESPADCYGEEWKSVSTNPCGEIPLCKYDSCRLLLMNLFGYVLHPFEPNAEFDFVKFKHDAIIAQRLMDDLVDLEVEAVDRILAKIQNDPEPNDLRHVEIKVWQKIQNKAKKGRRTGLGVTGEGDMLAALGLIYGTEEAISKAVEVHKTLATQSYISSIIMAEERGAFPIWNLEKEKDNPFLVRVKNEVSQQLLKYELMWETYGRRNISNLTIPPAGTTSLMTQTTSGVEPVFMVAYKRRRRTIDKLKATFTDEHGEMFEEYNVFHHKFNDWYDKNWFKTDPHLYDIDYKKPLDMYNDEELALLISKSPYHNATSADVNWVDKVKMQGAIQKWVDHSISATTNVPANTTVETVGKIYMAAYESGCKGMTIYREGSRSGILVSHKIEQSDDFNYIDAVKRPKLLECDIYHKTALKQDWMIIVGKLKGKPYEIFAFPELPNHIFPTKIEKGEVSKVKSGVYKLVGHDVDKSYEVPNIIDFIDEGGQAHTRKFSLMLRHHVDPVFIIKDINQYAIVTSFDKVIQRVLRNYVIEDGEKCSECGGDLIRQDGCVKCSQCSWSKCG
jgi:ribonucleoside-diphosphate reductase alpha chain